ncbi:hypothetical protein HUW51_04985 [Adhaeribacter swui]|uniref:Uncharacterized protein n=1 Tax=Adhaeribacter swui TaxID=2086471 RepID=A0A7G7G4N0_9BACT|nr:hypothetical protein [Adhaeribacter swui]QNF32114.1 hypothetical protein HUW51_04985 [Adhaeribacter swui]
MAESKLTQDEFLALVLQNVPKEQQADWLNNNSVQSAPALADGWEIVPKDRNLPNYRNLDDFQDYEHAREIE